MQPFTAISVFVIALVGFGHLVRAILSLELIIGGVEIPVWLSWPVAAVAFLLAVMLWQEARKGG